MDPGPSSVPLHGQGPRGLSSRQLVVWDFAGQRTEGRAVAGRQAGRQWADGRQVGEKSKKASSTKRNIFDI